ncbi:pullulanase [candidate division KSB1 bacterium]|nr:pullulanase [candidate division KSB1 bacterium]
MKIKDATCLLETSPIDIQTTYELEIEGFNSIVLRPDQILNEFQSDKKLGCFTENGDAVFRLFAPQAAQVQLALFNIYDQFSHAVHEMIRDLDGVWEIRLPKSLNAKYYAYRLNGRSPNSSKGFSEIDIPDPYSQAVVTTNDYRHVAKSLVQPDTEFDWQRDSWVCPKPESLMIYELHVRDMTAHETSGLPADRRGTYQGLSEFGHRGGLDYIRALGMNAVELLPVHEFTNIEIPYKDAISGAWNTWNPYARNHWGYMTSFYFAPESYYAMGQTLDPETVCGDNGSAVNELKSMVRAFHQAGIAVILDVVYNHVSNYDMNPLKSIDRDYYFKLDDKGHYCSESGCGNDLNTTRPMVRKMIVDSILHWMQTYHIDGFRFDLAGLIDDDTLDAISKAAREVNPDVILIGEPWGGTNHGQYRFSERDWSSWNDWYRNGIKGADPIHQKGMIFGQGNAARSIQSLKHFLRGTPASEGGQFIRAGHSVNYLASHDGYTLGDFIRIATGANDPAHPIKGLASHYKLSVDQIRIHKLAALILFTGQGAVMLHSGQEFARSKVIADTNIDDLEIGRLDHNSYNKDNETNWLNYDHVDLNHELVSYYKALIKIRKTYTHFTHLEQVNLQFIDGSNPGSLGMRLSISDHPDLIMLFNIHPSQPAQFNVDGQWELILTEKSSKNFKTIENWIEIPIRSGAILQEILNSK